MYFESVSLSDIPLPRIALHGQEMCDLDRRIVLLLCTVADVENASSLLQGSISVGVAS